MEEGGGHGQAEGRHGQQGEGGRHTQAQQPPEGGEIILVVSSVVDPDPYWIRIQELHVSGSVFGIRIRIHT